MKKLTLAWLQAAGTRAFKTIAQTAIGMITVGAAMTDINWVNIASVALVAGILSLLTSVATNLPELSTDGTLNIDTTDPATDRYSLELDTPLDEMASKKTITLTVKPTGKDPQ